MLVFVGDTHGHFKTLKHILREVDSLATVFHVGDFGYRIGAQEEWDAAQIDRSIYFIDGNHDQSPALIDLTEITEVWPNAFYIPRGTVMEKDGKRLAFMGGAGSVDKAWRHPGFDWFPEEQIRRYDVDKLIQNLATNPNDFTVLKPVDILVTHTPPNDCIQANFDPRDLVNYFNLPITWRDPSAYEIEAIAHRLGNPQIICGHMHRAVKWANVRILNINEVMTLE